MSSEAGNDIRPRRAPRWPWVILALLLVWPLLGAVAGRGAGVSTGETDALQAIAGIVVRDNYFESSALEISPGTTVVWTWAGLAPHNIVGKEFESPVQTSGVFSLAFANPGSYDYVCTLHRGMHGRVLVAEVPE